MSVENFNDIRYPLLAPAREKLTEADGTIRYRDFCEIRLGHSPDGEPIAALPLFTTEFSLLMFSEEHPELDVKFGMAIPSPDLLTTFLRQFADPEKEVLIPIDPYCLEAGPIQAAYARQMFEWLSQQPPQD